MEHLKVKESRLWSRPDILATILANSFVLDPTVILHNPRVYALENNASTCSFCAVVDHGDFHELKAVYTPARMRGNGYASRVIEHAVRDYPECYLICKNSLKQFYQKFQFKQVNLEPFPLAWKKMLYNSTLGRVTEPIISMVRSTQR